METNNKKPLVIGAFIVIAGFLAFAAYSIAKQVKKLKNLTAKFDSVEFLGFDLGEKKIGIKVNLKLKNESAFKITATGYKLDVFMNSVFVAPVVYRESQLIAANTESPISFNVYFSPFQIVKDLKWESILNGLKDLRNVKLKITGYISATIDGVKVENLPVSLEMLLGDLLKNNQE